MSNSSNGSDLEKQDHFDKETGEQPLTQAQEDAIEALEPPFTEKDEPASAKADSDGGSLTKIQSEKPSVNNIKLVPNGGLNAWLQVVSSFMVFFNTWGIINAFGIYQTYYEHGILAGTSPSDISWVGSISAFLLMLVGTFAGPIYDMGYIRQLMGVGSFLIVFGQMMLSLSSKYWHVFLAQGVSIGLGTGCIFVSGIAILSTHFSTRLATATGIAATGSSIGGMLYPIIFYKLQPHVGFAWATRALGFLALGTLLIANLFMRIRVKPAHRRKFTDLAAWKELPYTFFNIGCFFTFVGLYAPFFYIQSYVLTYNIMAPSLSFYLLAILNASSTFGRLLPNILADKFGPLNVIVPGAFMTGVLQFCLISAHSSASVIVIIAFYGFFSGTLVSLPATVYVHLAGPTNRGKIGTRMGMGFAFVAVGILIGTPITGSILKAVGFEYVWVFGGCLTCFGSLLLCAARFAQAKWRFAAKV